MVGRFDRLSISFGLLVVFATMSASGCSSIFGSTPQTHGAGGVALEATAGADPDVTPFILEVVEELNDENKVIIKGRLLPKTDWNASEVVVRLSALDRDGHQRVSYHRMSDVVIPRQGQVSPPLVLEKDVAQTFSLTLPVKGLSNYELGVLWGADAEPFADRKPPPVAKSEVKEFVALRNMEVHRVPTESCSSPDECLVKFTITGELFNAGGAIVKDVVIVAGFGTGAKLDLADQILENERRVEVPNLKLAPGGVKRFKISLEKLVPSSAQVAPQPIVRIASFRSE